MTSNEPQEIAVGSLRAVYVDQRVAHMLADIPARHRAHVRSVICRYCDSDLKYFDETQFRKEGRYSSKRKDGKQYQIWAFKGFQIRLYGSTIDFDTSSGRKSGFVITAIDLKKKQNKPDKELLKSAALALGRLDIK